MDISSRIIGEPLRQHGENILAELLNNILLFIPFGYLFCASYSNMRIRVVVLIGFMLSLLIETLQFCFALGVSEIDDLINNTLGTIIGALVYNKLKGGKVK